MLTKPKGVSSTHPDYDKFLPKWQRCSDAVAGQDAIHAKKETYLPKLANETAPDYSARLKRSNYFNATWRTIAGMTGMAFRKPPAISVPAGIEGLLDDITMSGVTLDSLAHELVEDVLEYGRMGLLVDHSPAPVNVVPLNVASSEQLGLRPSLQIYAAEHIINWKHARIRNAWTLTMVVLKEQAAVQEDEFTETLEDRYRVLDLDEAGQYRQRVFKVEHNKDILLEGPIYPTMNGKTLGFIPFSFVGTYGRGECIDEPPLIDLVDMNFAHYQMQSDYRHGLHFTAMPTLFLAGVTTEPGQTFYLGGQAAITAPDPQAKGMFIEFTGAGLKAIADALTENKQDMAVLGARMITDSHVRAETATATLLKRAGDYSILASTVIAVSEALEWALGIFAEWAGQAGEVVYQINREFTPAPMDAPTLTALVASWQAGAISEHELFTQLQVSDVIDGQKTFEEHQAEIDAAPPIAKPALPDKQAA